jgi:hypothetical protein
LAWANGTGANNRVADFVTIRRFDITGAVATCNGVTNQGACVCEGISSFGALALIQANYVHQILGQNSTTCGTQGGGGIVLRNNGNPASVAHDTIVDGNIIDQIGRGDDNVIGDTSQTIHGIYVASPRHTVTNNIVSRASSWGIHVFHDTCKEVVSNNTIINNLRGGIIISASTDTTSSTSTCYVGSTVIDDNTSVMNNLLYANGGLGGGSTSAEYGIEERYGPTGTNNVYRNNIIIQAKPAPFNFANGARTTSNNLCDVAGTGCATVITAAQATASNIWTSYTGNAKTGDYHLKAGSVAVGAGTATGCATGGLTPCVPTLDTFSTVRPNPPSVGASELLSGGGTPNIVVAPTSFPFGTVNVGVASTINFTVTNNGTASATSVVLSLVSVAPASDIVLNSTCGSTISAGNTCSGSLVLTATQTGAYTGTFRVASNAPQVNEAITANAVQPGITLSTNSVPFAPQSVNSISNAIPFTVASTGTSNLTITSVVLANTTDFAMTNPCTSPMAPGVQCTISPVFQPKSTGSKATTITITTNAGTQVVSLTGTPQQSQILVAPTSLSFSDTLVGATTPTQSVTLTNSGTGQAQLSFAIGTDYIQSNSCAAGFSDTFASGTLDPTLWVKDTGTAPGTSTGLNAGTFSTSNVDMTHSALGLKVTQTQAAALVTSSIDDFTDSGGTTGCSPSVSQQWCWGHDSGTPGTASATSALVASPSLDGQARRFIVSWTGFGGLRASAYLNPGSPDSTSTNFVYDIQVQFTDLTHVQNLEFDMNQGQAASNSLVIFGLQCSFSNGFWQYTTNATSTTSKWVNTSVPCARGNFPNNTWNHIQIGSHRDNSGNVTYDYVNVNGNNFNIGITAPSLFSVSWGAGQKVVNFQIDGDNTSSSTTAYIDQFSVTGNTAVTSVGAEVRSLVTYGYGTYDWLLRSASTATTPAGAGSNTSGQISSGFTFINNSQTELDSPEIEGQFPTLAEFTTWSSLASSQSNSVAVSTPFSTFHHYKVVWAPGSATYFIDGAQVATHANNVPVTPAYVLMNLWGTHSPSFGGFATPGTNRWMWVEGFSFVPNSTTIPSGGSCTIQVAFKPLSVGSLPEVLSITVPDGGPSQAVLLSGRGQSATSGATLSGGVTVTGGVKVLN